LTSDPTSAADCLQRGNGTVVGLVGSQTHGVQGPVEKSTNTGREVFEL
jgi:hypothetical protein